MAFEFDQQIMVGAAREHLGDIGPAGLQNLDREREPGLDQPHGAQVIGLRVADGIGSHVGQDEVGGATEDRLQPGVGFVGCEVHFEDRDSVDGVGRQQVDADHRRLRHLAPDHLAPAARSDPEVDHASDALQ